MVLVRERNALFFNADLHLAYAKKAQVTLPPLEEYEQKIVPLTNTDGRAEETTRRSGRLPSAAWRRALRPGCDPIGAPLRSPLHLPRSPTADGSFLKVLQEIHLTPFW